MSTFAPPSILLETSCGSPRYISPRQWLQISRLRDRRMESCYSLCSPCWQTPFRRQERARITLRGQGRQVQNTQVYRTQMKSLLKYLLIVDVAARITKSWLVLASTSLLRTFLASPPTVTEMIQPLASQAQIDENLLQYLPVFWGKTEMWKLSRSIS
ncbi:hypothetical protein SCLCIDRAFT_151373 [Scleroderma citrinum Foug A]|uniref:Uncharacterized protein n=1 Tax=Scleroderma citrinum Foug A TaxID=1036808 RepID=A0A0C3A9P7_9AGAM|nr:hypothetical protein SCLCIDRAFT_151373 [Scleroderma citrinum Foug A]